MKEDLKFRQDNNNITAIDRGIMSSEVECIPQSTIYSKENCVGDRAFTRNNRFKEREMLIDAGHQKLLQDMIVNRDRKNTGMN